MMLAQSGVSETELLRLVATAPDIDFDLRPVSIDAMMKIGVSQNVIKAMAARESGQPVAPSYSEQKPLSYAAPSPASSLPAAAAVLPAVVMASGPAETPIRPSPTPSVTPSNPPRMDSRTRIFIGETSEWQASSFNMRILRRLTRRFLVPQAPEVLECRTPD
jgi:hypothetical protein